MAYVRFVPGFTRHPKRSKCGAVSSWIWVCSVDYCATFMTDGFIEMAAVPTLCPSIHRATLKRAVDILVAIGSWEPVPGGYLVHDYLKHNLSKSEAERDQELAKQRYLRWKARHGQSQDEEPPVPNAVVTPLQPRLAPSPTPLQTRSNAVVQRRPNAVATLLTVSQSVLDTKSSTSKRAIAHAMGSDSNSTATPPNPDPPTGPPTFRWNPPSPALDDERHARDAEERKVYGRPLSYLERIGRQALPPRLSEATRQRDALALLARPTNGTRP
jgi:hypothetical protein